MESAEKRVICPTCGPVDPVATSQGVTDLERIKHLARWLTSSERVELKHFLEA